MNISIELEKIIMKYNLDKYYPLYKTWVRAGRTSPHFFIESRENVFSGSDELQLDDEDNGQTELIEYFYLCEQLKNDQEQDKNIILEKLFFISLLMKNFVRAEEWYLQLCTENIKWKSVWEEIATLLNRIKVQLEKKSNKHIIIYWLDHLPYEYAKDLPYLKSRRNHSAYFENAYTVTPFTHPTAKTMFCGINQMDNLGYKVKQITKQNSDILRVLEQRGYKLFVISKYFENYFEGAQEACGLRKREACSSIFWNLWQGVLDADEPTVFIAHALVETHSPTINTFSDNLKIETKEERLIQGAREFDIQLEFYDNTLGKSPYRFYLSDHGMWLFGKRYHTFLQVYHHDWEEQKIDKLFSLLDFSSLFQGVLEKQKIDVSSWDRDYAPLCDVAYYNKKMIGEILKKKDIYFPFYLAYKGVVTNKYIYIRFDGGYEWLVEKDNILFEPFIFEDTVRTKEQEEQLKELRRIVGVAPKDYINDEKFMYSKYLSRAFDNVRCTVNEMKKLLNDAFLEYGEASIAIRSGGYHSLYLYHSLNMESRKKIGAIIDANENCMCAKLGLPVYSPSDILPQNISNILLSSYLHLDDLKKEATSNFSNYEIIDIYDCFQQHGIQIENDFFFGKASDYEVEFPFGD